MKNEEYKTKLRSEGKPKFRTILKDELRAFFVEKPFNRVIAIIGCFITFIYGFFYIWAFFDPYSNLQRIPMAIINQDDNVCMIYKNDNDPTATGPHTTSLLNAQSIDYDYTAYTQEDCRASAQMVGKNGYYTSVTDEAITKLNFYNPNTNRFKYDLKVGQVEGDYVRYRGNPEELDNKYWVQIRIPRGFTQHLTSLLINMNKANFTCFDGFDSNGVCNDKDPEHTLDPKLLSGKIIQELKWYKTNKISLWGTFRHNFASGMITDFYQNISSSLAAAIAPQLLSTTLFTLFSYYEQNFDGSWTRTVEESDINRFFLEFLDSRLIPPVTYSGTSVQLQTVFPRAEALKRILDLTVSDGLISPTISDEIYRLFTGIFPISIPPIINNLFHSNSLPGAKIPPPYVWKINVVSQKITSIDYTTATMNYNDFVNAMGNFIDNGKTLGGIFDMPFELVGKQYSEYGIGLGQAFILIATYIGIFASTVIYNRRSRTPNTRFYQYYLSKILIFQVNTFIQVTILMLMLLAVGFTTLGSAYWLLYLFVLFMGFILTFIVTGIWFAIPDEVGSRVANLVFLMLNFACGWILFPAFMANDFYNGLSNIMPFTYGMHSMGEIIYGIAAGVGQIHYYQIDIIINCVILLAIAVFFIILALTVLHVRFLHARYGTRRIGIIFDAMGQVESTQEYARKRSVLLILKEEQKQQIKAKVKEILNKTHNEKYSYTKLSKRQLRKLERNAIED
ncbi:ABC transporter permease [Spiroplasma sp. DGKH1]|uniref:ABC transporter permease n=1 Tax=Spiroplasma sp. DGKH1 TaxID=3050074 RepID=UPI0034C661FF